MPSFSPSLPIPRSPVLSSGRTHPPFHYITPPCVASLPHAPPFLKCLPPMTCCSATPSPPSPPSLHASCPFSKPPSLPYRPISSPWPSPLADHRRQHQQLVDSASEPHRRVMTASRPRQHLLHVSSILSASPTLCLDQQHRHRHPPSVIVASRNDGSMLSSLEEKL
jgi:hypothetical protein